MINKIVIFLVLFPFILMAQEQPKVGLVLSGGGAKGFAHIGVLRELEKAGVQIDYIGGTSIGAIVGALYASGYTADQIEQTIKSEDFTSLLQDETPRREKTYFEKSYGENHAISLPIKDGAIGLPLGLSKGQNVLNLFTELLESSEAINDFSKLPIPFYCVATDIETGEEIVLEKGSLPLAIRASGSFPSLLNPVEIDGRLLVDGGVVNNFPVDIMKKKGINIIIGVNVQGELSERKDLKSIAAVLSQIINFKMYEKSDKQIEMVDVYMRPDVLDYSVISFDDANEIIKKGEKVAKPHKAVFDSIANLQTIKRSIPKVTRDRTNFLTDRIIINGNKNYTRDYILGKLKLKEGDSTSYYSISDKITTLSGTKNFKRIDYHFSKSHSGKKLNLVVKEEDITMYLRLGVHYDLLYKSGVLLNYNHKKILTKNDELSVDLVIGDNIRYDIQYFIDNGYLLSYGINSVYNSFSTGFLFGDKKKDLIENQNSQGVNSDESKPKLDDKVINKIQLKYSYFTTRVYGQTTIDNKFAFTFGLEHKKVRITSDTFLTDNRRTFFDDSNYLNAIAFLHMDTFNKKQFPTDGLYADIGFTWYLYSGVNSYISDFIPEKIEFSQFSQLESKLSMATSLGGNFTFQGTLDVGLTLSNEESTVFDFRLGGYNKNYINRFLPMYGYEMGELSEQSFFKTEFNFRYELFRKNYISFIANYARVENNIFKNLELSKELKSGYAVGYSLETLVGPVELKYAWSPDNNKKFILFNLGFWF